VERKTPAAGQLPPGDYLAGQKENSENGGDAPPRGENLPLSLAEKAVSGNEPSVKLLAMRIRVFSHRIRGTLKGYPTRCWHVLANDVSADQRHEKHQDAGEPQWSFR